MRKKIVVIEDEEQSGKRIQSYLEQHNYQVTYIRDGLSGLKTIQEIEPNLVLMDLLLPRMHGAEICKTMKKEPRLEHIPIIIMTSVYKKVIGKLQLELGVNEFMEKPLDVSILLEKIDRLIGKEPGMESEDDLPPIILSESELIPESMVDMSIYKEDRVDEDQQKIQPEFTVFLLDKVEQLEELWAVIQKSKDNAKRLGLLRQLTHKMISSGANFVFEEIIKDAQQLELLLDMVLMEGEDTLGQRKEKIDGLIDNLRLHPLITTEKQLQNLDKF